MADPRFAVLKARSHLELTIKRFAQLIGAAERSVISWEQGDHVPPPTTLALLTLIPHMPRRQVISLLGGRSDLATDDADELPAASVDEGETPSIDRKRDVVLDLLRKAAASSDLFELVRDTFFVLRAGEERYTILLVSGPHSRHLAGPHILASTHFVRANARALIELLERRPELKQAYGRLLERHGLADPVTLKANVVRLGSASEERLVETVREVIEFFTEHFGAQTKAASRPGKRRTPKRRPS